VTAALETLLVALAVTANTLFAWPQAIRILRSRTVAGVSPGTWTLSTAMFAVWGSYAAQAKYMPLLAANLACLVAACIIVATGTRAGWPAKWPLLAAGSIAGAVVAALHAPVLLATVMVGGGVVLRLPQIRKILRSKDTAGVSQATWLLSAATAALWMVLSIMRNQHLVAVANAAGLTMTLVLLALLRARRSKRCAPAT
jgi:uncharacterized protein with PQ loop repeat